MSERTLKYQLEINALTEKGVLLPSLFVPVSQRAYRYVFSTDHSNNHLPVYIQRPQRLISDSDKNRLNTSGYALSCYDQEHRAVQQYEALKMTMRHIDRSLGDALCGGVLTADDGLMTHISPTGHFDFYEFYTCDVSVKFEIKKKLI